MIIRSRKREKRNITIIVEGECNSVIKAVKRAVTKNNRKENDKISYVIIKHAFLEKKS